MRVLVRFLLSAAALEYKFFAKVSSARSFEIYQYRDSQSAEVEKDSDDFHDFFFVTLVKLQKAENSNSKILFEICQICALQGSTNRSALWTEFFS